MEIDRWLKAQKIEKVSWLVRENKIKVRQMKKLIDGPREINNNIIDTEHV